MEGRSRSAVILTLLLMATQAAFCLDLESSGLNILSQRTVDDRILYRVADSQGNEFTVVGAEDFTSRQLTIIVELERGFFSWEDMTVGSLQIVVGDGPAELLVIPAEYTYDGIDLTRYLPSGMQFFYDTYLDYDFRMKVGSIFVRMRGQYFDETQYSERLVSAARDPALFVAANDPEYLVRRILSTEEEIDRLKARDMEIVEELSGTQTDYREYKKQTTAFYEDYLDLKTSYTATKTDYESTKSDYLALKAEGARLKADYLGVKADHTKLRGEYEALLAAHDELSASHDNLLAKHDALDLTVGGLDEDLATLRTAFLAQNNAALFTGATLVDEELIQRTLQLRAGDVSMPAKDIVSALREEGIKSSQKVVKLIILAFLGTVD